MSKYKSISYPGVQKEAQHLTYQFALSLTAGDWIAPVKTHQDSCYCLQSMKRNQLPITTHFLLGLW